MYNQGSYGVLELASFEPFDQVTQQFLDETNRTIATAIHSQGMRKVAGAASTLAADPKEAEHAAREAELAKKTLNVRLVLCKSECTGRAATKIAATK